MKKIILSVTIFIITLTLIISPLSLIATASSNSDTETYHITPYAGISTGSSFLGDQLFTGIKNAGFHEDIGFNKNTTGFVGLTLGSKFTSNKDDNSYLSIEFERWGEIGEVVAEGTFIENQNKWEYDISYSSEAIFSSGRIHFNYNLLPEVKPLNIVPYAGILSIIGSWEIEGNANYRHVDGTYEEEYIFEDDYFEIEDDEDDIAIGYTAGARGELFPIEWLGAFGEVRYTLADFDDFSGDFALFDIDTRYSIFSTSFGIVLNINF